MTGTTQTRLNDEGVPDLEWVRDGEIVRCPWHRWEFEIATGKTVFSSRMRVAKYRVIVDSDADEMAAESDEVRYVETFPVSQVDGVVILEA